MPYAKIETNVKLDMLKEQELLMAASGFFAALLNKSEEHVMVSVSHGISVIFGKTDAPAAYVHPYDRLSARSSPVYRCHVVLPTNLSCQISNYLSPIMKRMPILLDCRIGVFTL